MDIKYKKLHSSSNCISPKDAHDFEKDAKDFLVASDTYHTLYSNPIIASLSEKLKELNKST